MAKDKNVDSVGTPVDVKKVTFIRKPLSPSEVEKLKAADKAKAGKIKTSGKEE